MVYEYMKNENGEYVCPHCNVTKKKQSTMHMHYRARHDGAYKHKCKHCTYETSTKQTLDKHILAKHPEHAKEKPKPFCCPTCEFESLTKGGLRSHYLLKHMTKEVAMFFGKNEKGGIQCTACSQQFASKPSYIYHLAGCLSEDILSNGATRIGLGLSTV